LIADLNESSRIAAFNIIAKNFISKSKYPVVYAIGRENGSFLIHLIEYLEKVDPFLCRKALINRIYEIDDQNFQSFLSNRKIESLSFKDLKEFFFNYLFLDSLENLYFHRRKIPFAVDLFYID
jgi:hypothetical protein